MARDLDISLLRAFVAVADQRSMTSASRVLHLTQGAVSQRITRLEAITGSPLLTRDRRGVHVTASGERLLRDARRLLGLNDEIWAEIDGGGIKGPVRLGVPFDIVGSRLPPILKGFAEACPHVALSLTCGSSVELGRSLADGAIDAALLEQPAAEASGECLDVERLVWVGARGGRAQRRSPLPVSLVAESCAFRPAVTSALKMLRRDWRTVFESGSLDATIATVRADLAISAWLGSMIPAGLEPLSPAAGLPELPSFAITLHVVDRPDDPVVKELARHLRQGFTRAEGSTDFGRTGT